MKKTVALSLVLAASLGLAACSKPAAENAVDANAAAADLNATADETLGDVNAAIDNAADAALDNAAAATADNAANAL
ncbi:hypothetical protein CLG96_11200 [Sphingomonas oleivorans]|uniref:Circumsporozoite protein n=1 Tax=Sphingomonas oleivorans TaxID=1735121 RepID=A0A2T5FXS1_9SPHN|nr:hypothetical protein [Sphingomonas oleivorans]PTQ10937.1 hypothetical protein CLG96_11200 [Sphingomonas oleivorans]